MIKFESSSHWYGRDGKPQHDADLRVARREKLYPSVTTIDKEVFKNDFLDRWKMNELALAASSTFRQAHEDDEAYVNRIYELSLEKSKTASEFGTEIHSAIEDYPKYPAEPKLHKWVDRFGEWYEANVEKVISRERTILDHGIGVAGRCDLVAQGRGRFDGSIIIPDWKTQNVKVKDGKKKPAFYDSWPRQLSFYAVSYAKEAGTFPDHIPTCISVVIDSNEPETPFERVWTREEIVRAYKQFLAGAWLWFDKKKYHPTQWDIFTNPPQIPNF